LRIRPVKWEIAESTGQLHFVIPRRYAESGAWRKLLFADCKEKAGSSSLTLLGMTDL
jgi:hypothetical protein